MTKKLEIARVDVVGSFLRPDSLKKAREDFEIGKITEAQLKKVEDTEIEKLIEREKEIGLKFFTDGEFRRSWWHLDFFWGLQGVKKIDVKEGYIFHDEVTRPESATLTGKISGENHPFVEHYKFIKKYEDKDHFTRQTIPAPAQLLKEIDRNPKEEIEKIYPSRDELINDIAKAYKHVILDLYKNGCRNLQLDDCTWGMVVDKNYQDNLKKQNIDFNKEVNELLLINNKAISDLPDDLLITTHVCRGNYHSSYASSGAYDEISDLLFAKENVDCYYLEYDTKRAGGFEPLKKVSPNKKVVLGLISSKFPKLEDKGEILDRIKEASKYIPIERISISPQCGFASTEEGNILTIEEQWRKIKLLWEIAEEAFNN